MFLLDDPLEQRMQLRYQETKNVVAIKLSATAALLPPTSTPRCTLGGFRMEKTGCAHLLSLVLFFVTQWTVAHRAPLSLGFPRQEY